MERRAGCSSPRSRGWTPHPPRPCCSCSRGRSDSAAGSLRSPQTSSHLQWVTAVTSEGRRRLWVIPRSMKVATDIVCREREREPMLTVWTGWLLESDWTSCSPLTTKSPPPGVGARSEETDRRCQTDRPHVSLTSLSVYMGFMRFWGSIRGWQWCCRSNVSLEAADSLCSSYSWRNFSMTKTFVRQNVGWWVVGGLQSPHHITPTHSSHNQYL